MAEEIPSSPEVVATAKTESPEVADLGNGINDLELSLINHGMEQVGMVDRMNGQLGSNEALELQLEIANQNLRLMDNAALALTFDHLGNQAVEVSVQKQLTELLGVEWRKTLNPKGATIGQSTYATIGDIFVGSDKANGERSVTMGYTHVGDTLELTVMASADATRPEIPSFSKVTPTVGVKQGPVYVSVSVPLEGAGAIQNYEAALGIQLPAGITARVERTPDETIASLGATYHF